MVFPTRQPASVPSGFDDVGEKPISYSERYIECYIKR
jgi:hypothetical protein